MTANKIISDSRIRVYKLAVAGVCQIEIARITKLKKPTVNIHIKALLDEKFLELDTSKHSKVKIYKKGARSNILDSIILRLENLEVSSSKIPSGSDFSSSIAGGGGYGYIVQVYNVHHVAFKRGVSKQGDSQFLSEPSYMRSGVKKWVGYIQSSGILYKHTERLIGSVPRKDDREITLTLYESADTDENGIERENLSLMIHAPALLLSDDLIDDYEIICREICRDIYSHLERNYGWHYNTEILATEWDVHVAVEEPELQGMAKYATVKSDDGKLISSNSNGTAEIEAHGKENIQAVKAYVNLPNRMDNLDARQTQLHQYQKAQLSYIELIKSEQETMSEMMLANQKAFAEFLEMDTKRLKIMSRNISQDLETLGIVSSDFGGMYQ